MKEINPDNWVMIKMTYRDFVTYKILGENANTWCLLSHVKSVASDPTCDTLRFTGFHDTVYVVDPDTYGISAATEEIWNTMKTTHPENVELMENRDWSTFDFGTNNG